MHRNPGRYRARTGASESCIDDDLAQKLALPGIETALSAAVLDGVPAVVSRPDPTEEAQMTTSEEEFIPYLVLVRFDKDGGDLKARITESAPALKEALLEVGTVQFVEMSYDGSMAAYLVAANPRFENSLQVQLHLQSPRSRQSSPLIVHDKVLVVSIEQGSASRVERTTSWLREYGLLIE